MNRKWGRQKTTGLWMMVIGSGMCLFALATLASRSAATTNTVKIEPVQAVKQPNINVVGLGEAVEIYIGNTRCVILPVKIDGTDYFITTSNCTLTYKGWR